MARSFDGAADYLENTVFAPVTSFPITFACWFKTTDTSTTQCIASICTNGENGRLHLQAVGNVAGDPVSALSINTAGTLTNANSTTGYTSGQWHHVIGRFVSTTERHCLIDGGSQGTDTSLNDPSVGGFNRFLIGARRRPDGVGNFFNGEVAEVGVWSADLSAGERAMLAAGLSPLFVRPGSLAAYVPAFGSGGAASNEIDWANGGTLTQTSSPAVTDHPRIIYPRRRAAIMVAPAASGAPTLSDLKAASITATTVQGTYDYAF